MTGKALGPYQISERLREGGMGVVWKAHDTRLNRSVVLKCLSTETLADLERKRRFARQVKSASALNDPNMVPIYDIGGIDDNARFGATRPAK